MTDATNNEATAAINNLAEFIEARGAGDTFYQWARAVYKYGIGSWAVMVVEDTPARDVEYTITISHDERNKITAGSLLGVPHSVRLFFSLDEDSVREDRYDFDDYYKLLEDYDQSTGDMKFAFEYGGIDSIIITGTYHINATTRDIYYEDSEANTDVSEISPKVIGIRCGSIIEGADYDATPFYLEFPFTMDQFNSCMEELESEVDLEWHKNNTTYFSLTNRVTGEKAYFGEWVAFADEPTGTWGDDPVIKEIAIAGGEMVLENAGGEISGFPGWWVDEEIMDF